MTISNSQLALQISELVDRWRTREAEYNTWLNGEAGGGDSGDGRYPLTDYDGVVHYAKSPAQLEADVSGLVDSASSYADAAAASALAAASAAVAAETAASLAETHKATAATHAGLAEISAAEAANSASIAATNKSSSASSAAAAEGYAEDAAESATEAKTYSEAAAGSATDAASSASEAAESATAAAASATAAEAAQVAAESAEATVEAHSIAAQEARAAAEEARDDAAAYASTAASAASSATASKTAAGNSAVAAASSASSAASSATAASASASDASGYADDAAASALAAAASAAAAATFEPDNYLLKSGGTLSGDLGIRGGPSAAYLDIYTNHADYPITKASLRISNANAGGQSVIDFVHSSTLKARIRSDYAGGLIFAAHDQIFFYTGGDYGTGWQRMVLQNNGTLYVDPGAAIRFGHANQTNLDDGMIAAGRFDTGLNIVGVQTAAGTGRQIRLWGNTYWDQGAPYIANAGAIPFWTHSTYTSGAMTVSSSPPTPEGIGHIWFEV